MNQFLKVFLFCSQILAFPQIPTCSLSLFLTVNDRLRHFQSTAQEFRRPNYGTLGQSSGESTFSFVKCKNNPHDLSLRSLTILMDCDLSNRLKIQFSHQQDLHPAYDTLSNKNNSPESIASPRAVLSCLIVSDSLQPRGLQPARLLCPCGGHTGVDCHAGILEWIAMLSSRGSFQFRDRTHVFHVAGGFFTV